MSDNKRIIEPTFATWAVGQERVRVDAAREVVTVAGLTLAPMEAQVLASTLENAVRWLDRYIGQVGLDE